MCFGHPPLSRLRTPNRRRLGVHKAFFLPHELVSPPASSDPSYLEAGTTPDGTPAPSTAWQARYPKGGVNRRSDREARACLYRGAAGVCKGAGRGTGGARRLQGAAGCGAGVGERREDAGDVLIHITEADRSAKTVGRASLRADLDTCSARGLRSLRRRLALRV
ncbi:hypothetical protein CONPUDRAFT_159496 [Coniophora puteana RWD-64-598 SS2]|uniref:Uncharacterized protein n=1 Tax=Coniophora puteana (strain RWD-64-598) TaxID=741705 RepID=A0A5M3M9N2_CONPW|nr:uncharacterized protein CONPUDRAFT_159496 [Coniophora puteana RWD-64-598 SS2]EIW75375.1 hypothetical protein CONPUDRAFT_159496 [Coniophora puteana RWD-64-598 SS2]